MAIERWNETMRVFKDDLNDGDINYLCLDINELARTI